MKKFTQFQNLKNVQSDIERLLIKCEELPDTDVDSDLFAVKNKKSTMIYFFKIVLSSMDEELANRLSSVKLDDEPIKVFFTINGRGHPVRDYLILKNNNLL